MFSRKVTIEGSFFLVGEAFCNFCIDRPLGSFTVTRKPKGFQEAIHSARILVFFGRADLVGFIGIPLGGHFDLVLTHVLCESVQGMYHLVRYRLETGFEE